MKAGDLGSLILGLPHELVVNILEMLAGQSNARRRDELLRFAGTQGFELPTYSRRQSELAVQAAETERRRLEGNVRARERRLAEEARRTEEERLRLEKEKRFATLEAFYAANQGKPSGAVPAGHTVSDQPRKLGGHE